MGFDYWFNNRLFWLKIHSKLWFFLGSIVGRSVSLLSPEKPYLSWFRPKWFQIVALQISTFERRYRENAYLRTYGSLTSTWYLSSNIHLYFYSPLFLFIEYDFIFRFPTLQMKMFINSRLHRYLQPNLG